MNNLDTALAALRSLVAANGLAKTIAALELVAWDAFDGTKGDKTRDGLVKSINVGAVCSGLENAAAAARLAGA